MSIEEDLIGAIDQGTTSSRFLLFSRHGQVRKEHQLEFKTVCPNPGWEQQDPHALLQTVQDCMAQCAGEMKGAATRVKAIGVTNQRETTVLWDKVTGEPLHDALVWKDGRTGAVVKKLIARFGGQDHFRARCGLPLSTYFSAVKVLWLMEHVEAVRTAIAAGTCLFGTVDTWLIWNLTGGVSGGQHVTDVTNASRTLLMNVQTCAWDESVCAELGIPLSILPRICSSAEVYGVIAEGPLKGVPLAGCLGDQQAALVGQMCFQPGQVKNTYGTGCFMLMNTGGQACESKHGLLTTVGYQLGKSAPVVYALEGSVAVAGAAVVWARDEMGLIESSAEIGELAGKVDDNGNVYFVPAFSGLLSPYWRPDARGVMVGITKYTTKNHVCRAVLESVAYQTKDVLMAMTRDSQIELAHLKVDGGMTANQLLMQFQSDLLSVPIERAALAEATAAGAAIAAGLCVGFWKDTADVQECFADEPTVFAPAMDAPTRTRLYKNWKRAVTRSFHWASEEDEHFTEHHHSTHASASWRKVAGIAHLVLTTGLLVYLAWSAPTMLWYGKKRGRR
jgi:glycerol kinase